MQKKSKNVQNFVLRIVYPIINKSQLCKICSRKSKLC